MPTNLANVVKEGPDLKHSRCVQSRRPENAHQNIDSDCRVEVTSSQGQYGSIINCIGLISLEQYTNPFWMDFLTRIFTLYVLNIHSV